ncbi:MAG: bifunctional phosphopantothenoylcysteine decarboxylase/phosphopantothenate--cysteine ligase CoaBC [Lentisphaeria bacterium]
MKKEDKTKLKTRDADACIALGVSSSIAAYKAADLVSRLVKLGVEVNVIMTENATKLVAPRTFLTLSQRPVITSLWETPDWRPEHIALSEKAQLLVIAPATANVIAKLAHGIADDALLTFALAHEGPVLVAPAMNPKMWRHPAVRENCRILKERGVIFVYPESGPVACGDEQDAGRLADVGRICNAVEAHLAVSDELRRVGRNRRLVVTAGPTRENLDPVRFLTNRSSGKMGYAVAEAASAMGFETVLISGPVNLPLPANCEVLKVSTAAEMNEAVMREFGKAEALVMCAAVADFTPAEKAVNKLKKGAVDSLQLSLQRTPDILANVAEIKTGAQTVIGFAAESGDPIPEARRKLAEKRLDLVVANDISRDDIGFGSQDNEVTLVSDGESEKLPRLAKIKLAVKILAKTF